MDGSPASELSSRLRRLPNIRGTAERQKSVLFRIVMTGGSAVAPLCIDDCVGSGLATVSAGESTTCWNGDSVPLFAAALQPTVVTLTISECTG
jgi:hypothetical protein